MRPSRLFAASPSITVEFQPTNKLIQAFEGESIREVAEKAGVKINYKCRKGECGTCQVKIDGKWVKACQSVVSAPSSSSVLQISVSPKTAEDSASSKKPSKFFSPASFVEGVINNGLGVVGFVMEAKKVDNSFEQRMAKEKALLEKVAAEKARKQNEGKR